MTQHELTPETPAEIGGLFDDFSVFAESAWKPYEHWDKEPLTREALAESLYDMGQSKQHEMRAAMLYRFSRHLADRLGASEMTLVLDDRTSYKTEAGLTSLSLDYRVSMVGRNANQQLNAWIGLLIRGIGQYHADQPDSKVREFMDALASDFAKYTLPDLGDYVAQTAQVAIVDRAISALIAEEYPGFSKMALDGLYQLQAAASQEFFATASKVIESGIDPDGKALKREDLVKWELEMASQYLQAETTAPGSSYVDSTKFPWSMDIEQAGTFYRNISDLEIDHEFAAKGNKMYGEVVERILDLPKEPPQPPSGDEGGEGGELPDLEGLQAFHTGSATAMEAAKEATAPGSAMDQAAKLPTDQTIKWDKDKFEQILDQETEMMNERTPWAEGNPRVSYFTVKAKAGDVARSRYQAISRAYGPQIRKLRNIIEEQYSVRTVTERGLRTGRPDSIRLASLELGKTEVFKRNVQHVDGEPIDIVILVDESGSMGAQCTPKGYMKLPKFVPAGLTGERSVAMAGGDADLNVRAECHGGTRADVARAFAVILNQACRGMEGIRVWTLGYTTDDGGSYGAKGYDSMIRVLGEPSSPYGAALNLAYGGNGDKEALAHGTKILKDFNKGARQCLVYLADGGITDQLLEKMLKNIQRKMPVFFVDMSNSVRGTGGSLKIDLHFPVNSIPDAVKALGNFFRDVVLA